jgi:hypothetical protein
LFSHVVEMCVLLLVRSIYFFLQFDLIELEDLLGLLLFGIDGLLVAQDLLLLLGPEFFQHLFMLQLSSSQLDGLRDLDANRKGLVSDYSLHLQGAICALVMN